ncbi:hypothetical protein [Pseudomonas sp. MN1F]|uniref:hypothetical protein n=1 Tax=Pseudomonas sp. MN1F TaxID=1366632 RepID=UPI00128F78B9|nr:hypothetical protein [Pseudomonas sp. MN1F]MQG91327.1 hypothetical protein [Pseudomonas sp. MN1F]
MNLFEVERSLLLAVHEGQEVAEGEEFDTCTRLIQNGLVTGYDVSSFDGNKYEHLKITAIGRELVNH